MKEIGLNTVTGFFVIEDFNYTDVLYASLALQAVTN